MSIRGGWTIQEIVNDPEWQQVRESLVGTWKKHPQANSVILRAYIQRDPSDPFRWHRVQNYLTGTGFRTKQISHASIDKLLAEVKIHCAAHPLPRK